MAEATALRLYAFASGTGDLTPPVIQNAQVLPLFLPFMLTEAYSTVVSDDPGVLWLTEELAEDEINATGTAVIPFELPSILATSVRSQPIAGQITTRRYTFDSMEKKRFSKASLDVVLHQDSAASANISTINPDTETKLLSMTNATQEDYVRRVRVARLGYGAELIIKTTSGRASIRAASLEAVLPGATTKSED